MNLYDEIIGETLTLVGKKEEREPPFPFMA